MHRKLCSPKIALNHFILERGIPGRIVGFPNGMDSYISCSFLYFHSNDIIIEESSGIY